MAFSTGIDRRTGQPLSDWDHVQQHLEVLFATRIGTHVMRRRYGSAVPPLFLRNLTPPTLARVFAAMVMAVDLWEPRFRIARFDFPSQTNSSDLLRVGRFGLHIPGIYRPRALQGDFTPDPKLRTVIL